MGTGAGCRSGSGPGAETCSIGPDNGLLVPAAGRLGGIVEVRALENRGLHAPGDDGARSTAATSSRRWPAHLAAGRPFAEVGPAIDPGSIVSLRFPDPTIAPGVLETSVVYVDSFGNLRLAGDRADLAAAIGPLEPGRRAGRHVPGGRWRSGDPRDRAVGDDVRAGPRGRPLLYEDSFGRLAYADNQGDVARRLGIGEDRPARIEPA